MNEQSHIHKALATVIHATESSSFKWVVGGSAGLMLRGLSLSAQPRDLDLYCDEEDAYAIYMLLREYAVDEPTVSVTDMYRSMLCHFNIHHVQVELVGGFQVTALGCRYETNVRNLLVPYGEQVSLTDQSVLATIVPLAHELWFNALRGRQDRVELIVQAFAEAPAIHERALLAIEAENSFTEDAKQNLRRFIMEREAGDLR